MTLGTEITWDGFTAEALARRCEAPRLELLAETDSTLDVAHALADRGAPAGTVVVADSQRAGRGRQGRSWSSQMGRGVWCTVIERPTDAKILDVLSIRIGIRLAESLDSLAAAGETVLVKWPNDLVVGRGKVGGILTEARWSGSVIGWVAVGVGVNVVPPEDIPTAAGLESGTRRADVLQAIVRAVRASAGIRGELTQDELRRFAARDALAQRPVVSPARGIAAGISASGALQIDTSHGREEHRAGTVRFAEES
jgi:BirA family biotin operon repressor/biotin-[acetyl-CoA-carboxylase] ligase